MIEIFLDEFHFSTLWNAGLLLFSLFYLICYFFLLPAATSLKKAILTVLGIIIAFLAIGSPLNIVARLTFQAHMVQLVLLLLIAAPLIVIGWKPTGLDKIIWLKNLGKWFTHPLAAFILFLLFFYGYHIPAIFDMVRIELYWNHFFLFGLFSTSILLWVAILHRFRDKNKRWLYAGILHLFLIPYLIYIYVASEGVYRVYTDVDLFMSALAVCLPEDVNIPEQYYVSLLPFDPVQHQQAGIVIYWVASSLIFIALIYLKQWQERKGILKRVS